MLDRLTNYINNEPNNITCSDLIPLSITYNKVYFYNSDVEQPLQKYWFYLKNVKVIEKNSKSLKIVLSNSKEDKKFIEYIDKLDIEIYNFLQKKYVLNDKNMKKSYDTKDFHPNIFTLDCTNITIHDEDNVKNKNKYKNKNKNCFNYDYMDGYTISIIIELSDIIINDSEYWINYSIRQMKIKKDIINDSIFDMIESNIESNKNMFDVKFDIPKPPTLPNITYAKSSKTSTSKSTSTSSTSSTPINSSNVNVNTDYRSMITEDALQSQLKKIGDKKIINTMENKMNIVLKEMELFKKKKIEINKEIEKYKISNYDNEIISSCNTNL